MRIDTTSIQPGKAYEDETVMMSGPVDNGQLKSTCRLASGPHEISHGTMRIPKMLHAVAEIPNTRAIKDTMVLMAHSTDVVQHVPQQLVIVTCSPR